MPSKNPAVTVVRAPLPVRARMAALERISPSRAAVVAERLWFTVPSPPTPARQKRFTPDGGAPFFLMSGPSELAGVSFGPEDGPLALLVHGWGGYWQQLSAHVPALVAAGYHVLAWDAPSHGRSTHGAEGQGSGSVLEMTAAIETVVRDAGRPSLVVAHSIGAMAALRATRQVPAADAYVFIAPEVRLEPAIDWFVGITGMGPRTRQEFLRRINRRISLPIADFDTREDVVRLAADGPLPHLLAVHDTDDHNTPAQETERFVEEWPGAELMTTSGLGHRQVIWHAEVVKRVGAFVDGLPPVVVPKRGDAS